MTVLTLSLILIALGLAFIGAAWFRGDPYDDWPIGAFAVGGILVFAGVLVSTITYTERHFGRVSCDTFARQTGRPTKFVLYNIFSTGDCLTRTRDGKWIPTSNLREFGDNG